MGNCLTNNKILAQDDDHENYNDQAAKVEKMKTSFSSKFEAPRKEKCMSKKKVRFEIQNDEDGDGRGSDGNSRSVRIRVVMTQDELKRMLSCKDENENTSLEQLLSVMKSRGGKICKHDLGLFSWSPNLESIPEDA
uniref:Uncharacterized protein LOC101495778 n=1 Tax=Cicer arietinum TaxID=3827 RepID=A0A1S2Z8S7_CICAR|nr:uncharacterized protein LOC101495778 [Cicer arietinum]